MVRTRARKIRHFEIPLGDQIILTKVWGNTVEESTLFFADRAHYQRMNRTFELGRILFLSGIVIAVYLAILSFGSRQIQFLFLALFIFVHKSAIFVQTPMPSFFKTDPESFLSLISFFLAATDLFSFSLLHQTIWIEAITTGDTGTGPFLILVSST